MCYIVSMFVIVSVFWVCHNLHCVPMYQFVCCVCSILIFYLCIVCVLLLCVVCVQLCLSMCIIILSQDILAVCSI